MAKQYIPPLILTTPLIKGDKVRDAQWLLAGNNRFKGLAVLKDAQIDEEYGPVTATATARAKYWVGYPANNIDQVFGQTLYEYLRPRDWRPLPDDYRERREARLKEVAAKQTAGAKALAYAITELGNEENPAYSNLTKYGRWFGFNGVPWCAIFASYCFAHSGYLRFKSASCQEIYYAGHFGRNGTRQVWTPRPGDLVIYNFHGDRFAHTAFFERWIKQGVSFQDLGGNTGKRSFNAGGEVARGVRSVGQVTAYVRVG